VREAAGHTGSGDAARVCAPSEAEVSAGVADDIDKQPARGADVLVHVYEVTAHGVSRGRMVRARGVSDVMQKMRRWRLK
jgi:hypothetical protein